MPARINPFPHCFSAVFVMAIDHLQILVLLNLIVLNRFHSQIMCAALIKDIMSYVLLTAREKTFSGQNLFKFTKNYKSQSSSHSHLPS